MALPAINTALAALAVAIYAAIVSTVTGIVQIFNYRRDRPQIILRAGCNMVMHGPPNRAGLTIVTVMNTGRRPVTITSVGAWRLHPHNPIVIPETHPALPCELTEGKNVIAVIPPSDLDLRTIQHWEAYDAVGRSYQLSVAPWHKRLLSQIRWRKHIKQRQLKQTAG